MRQLSHATCQTAANLSKRIRLPQLAKHHRHELIPTAKPAGVPFRFRVLYRILKFQPRKKLEQLTKDAAKSCCIFHKGVDLPFDVSFAELPSSDWFNPFLLLVRHPQKLKS
jgi:hypothetical protein